MNNDHLVTLPLDKLKLNYICSILKKKNIICTIYNEDIFNPYSIEDYLNQIVNHKHSFEAIFDTNIIIDLLRICDGAPIQVDDNLSDTKLTSLALLILFQCLDIKIEPLIGIHEPAQVDNYKSGNKNLSFFRAIDNVHPAVLFRLIEDSSFKITPRLDVIDYTIDNKLNPFQWHYWFLNYTSLLKIALLEETSEDNLSKFKSFIKWMWEDFIFCAPATVYSMVYFSKNRLGKMLKRSAGKTYDDYMKMLKNIAWDLCALQSWTADVAENHSKGLFNLFCTQDKILQAISKQIVISRKNEDQIKDADRNFYIKYWGTQNGSNLYDYYKEYFNKHDSKSREERLHLNQDKFSKHFIVLEDEIKQLFNS